MSPEGFIAVAEAAVECQRVLPHKEAQEKHRREEGLKSSVGGYEIIEADNRTGMFSSSLIFMVSELPYAIVQPAKLNGSSGPGPSITPSIEINSLIIIFLIDVL